VIEYLPRNVRQTDLYLTQYGIEHCVPGHDHGPAVRDHYLMHYILDGSGLFEVGGVTYRLGKGQGFLICPDVVTYYQADRSTPWHYCWIGFNGRQAEAYLKQGGLSASSPVFGYDKDDAIHKLLLSMIETKPSDKARDIRLSGLLYSMMALIIENSPNTPLSEKRDDRIERYVNQAVDFIEMHYSEKIAIGEIANFIGLNRNYLCSLFKARMNSSLQQYLIHYRIQKACELMANRELSISDISRSVGYEDPLLFSKIFKKLKGLSPMQYRQQNA